MTDARWLPINIEPGVDDLIIDIFRYVGQHDIHGGPVILVDLPNGRMQNLSNWKISAIIDLVEYGQNNDGLMLFTYMPEEDLARMYNATVGKLRNREEAL